MFTRFLFVVLIYFFALTQGAIADFGRNEIGAKVGYFNPVDYDPYFPIQSELTAEYLIYDNAVIDVFYNRKINSELDVGFDLGFTGVLDKSDHNTILDSFPMSVYVLMKLIRISGVEAWAGCGLNFWYMEDGKGAMKGINGAHIKLDFRYQVLHAEIAYSAIDDFGEKEEDIGGFTLKVGVGFVFSYN